MDILSKNDGLHTVADISSKAFQVEIYEMTIENLDIVNSEN